MGVYNSGEDEMSNVAQGPPQFAVRAELAVTEGFTTAAMAGQKNGIPAFVPPPMGPQIAPEVGVYDNNPASLVPAFSWNLLNLIALPMCLFSGDVSLIWCNKRARILALERRGLPESVSDEELFANLRQHLREVILTARCWTSDKCEVAYNSLPGETISLFRVTNDDQIFVFAMLVEKTPGHDGYARSRWSAFGLTMMEHKIAEELLHGRTAAEIAQYRGIKLHTVRTHIKHIYSKLGVHCREKLLATMTCT